jgi:hypothetical protein
VKTAQRDWRRARRERRALDRRLPDGLRRDLRGIVRDDIGHDAARAILVHVQAIARKDDALRAVRRPGSEPWSYVLPAVEREILARLDANGGFRQQVRADVRTTLRIEHRVKVDPAASRITLPESLGLPPLADDLLAANSSIGLGTASVLEAEPEGWNHWVAAQIANMGEADDGLIETRRVLVAGALAGGFARAVAAMGAARLVVTEIDWVFAEATNLACVEGRGLAEPMGTFDAAVAVFPAPSVSGAANQRRIYGPSDLDIAVLGPRRWRRLVLGYLGLLNIALDVGRLVYVLLPLGVRHHRGYEAAPDLLDEVLSRLAECGFELIATLPTIEVEPVAQPFVGTNRPPKVTLVLQRSQTIEGVI